MLFRDKRRWELVGGIMTSRFGYILQILGYNIIEIRDASITDHFLAGIKCVCEGKRVRRQTGESVV
jgi:hypothetical protein